MDYARYTIHFVRPLADLDIDRIFPRSFSKRKTAFMLLTEGMTVEEWLKKVAEHGLQKVDISFLTGCYAKVNRNRLEPKLIELRPPVTP